MRKRIPMGQGGCLAVWLPGCDGTPAVSGMQLDGEEERRVAGAAHKGGESLC